MFAFYIEIATWSEVPVGRTDLFLFCLCVIYLVDVMYIGGGGGGRPWAIPYLQTVHCYVTCNRIVSAYN